MSLEQRLTANDLQAQGYTISTGLAGVLAVRGNDCRLVLADGSMRRAMGGKR
jgi:hypothetical protein